MAYTAKFKSSGKTAIDLAQKRAETEGTPKLLGIRTPIRLGTTGDGIYAMHTSLIEQIADNLRNLVLTNHGERLGLYDFGANLQPLMSELVGDASLEEEAMSRIRTAVTKWMPHVALETFQVKIDHEHNEHVAKVSLGLTWGVPTLGISGRKLEVRFFLM